MSAKNSLPMMEDPRPATHRQRHRPFAFLLVATLAVYLLYSSQSITTYVRRAVAEYPDSLVSDLSSETQQLLNFTTSRAEQQAERVPLEAHIMSKCPDARDCLKSLVLPSMQRVSDKVNFTLSFIGTPTENDGVACMHGPNECMGDILELCAAHIYPDPKIYLGFTMCLAKEFEHIPQRGLVEDCALEHAIDFKKLNECATREDGAFGLSLLRNSVQRSGSAGVTKSCTVRLDDKIYCIRDGGQWVDCPHGEGVNDLVIAVEKLYRRS
jgi:hypothetical protein